MPPAPTMSTRAYTSIVSSKDGIYLGRVPSSSRRIRIVGDIGVALCLDSRRARFGGTTTSCTYLLHRGIQRRAE